MSPEYLARIPRRLLFARDTRRLMAWLAARGWRLSLLELGQERERRERAAERRGSRVRRAR